MVMPHANRTKSTLGVHQGDVVRSRNLGGMRYLTEIGNDVETAFDKRFHDSRADPLRRSGHDGALGAMYFQVS